MLISHHVGCFWRLSSHPLLWAVRCWQEGEHMSTITSWDNIDKGQTRIMCTLRELYGPGVEKVRTYTTNYCNLWPWYAICSSELTKESLWPLPIASLTSTSFSQTITSSSHHPMWECTTEWSSKISWRRLHRLNKLIWMPNRGSKVSLCPDEWTRIVADHNRSGHHQRGGCSYSWRSSSITTNHGKIHDQYETHPLCQQHKQDHCSY